MALRRVLAALGLALALCPATTTAVALQPPDWLVRGEGASTTTVYVATETTLDFHRVQVLTRGRYGGLVIYGADDGKEYGGVLALPETAMVAETSRTGVDQYIVRFGPLRATLPAGWYRLVALTDGVVDVRIPVASGSGLRAVTRTPTRTPQRYEVRRATLDLSTQGAEFRVPLGAVADRTKTLLVARLESAYLTGGHRVRLCLPKHGKPCAGRVSGMDNEGSGGWMSESILGLGGDWATGHDAVATATAQLTVPASFTFVVLQYSATG